MKSKSLRTKLGLLAITACAALATPAQAAVIWLASDDGTNLTLTTDGGTIEWIPSTSVNDFDIFLAGWGDDSGRVWNNPVSGGDAVLINTPGGTFAGNDPWIAPTTFTQATGDTFGTYSYNYLVVPSLAIAATGTFTPNSTMTFSNLTVADAFGSNLNSGPVLLYTSNLGGTNTISVALVPEPSSAALLGLGGLALMLRRRR